MDIKPLRSMIGAHGKLRRNVIKTGVPDDYGQALIKRGLAVPVQAGDKKAATKKGAAKSASARPHGKSRSGGRSGAKAKPSS